MLAVGTWYGISGSLLLGTLQIENLLLETLLFETLWLLTYLEF